MTLRLYRKLKGTNPANSIVSGNLAINGIDFLAQDGVDTETLFEISIDSQRAEVPKIKEAVVEMMVNPNQHTYILQRGEKVESDPGRGRYQATVVVETDFDPEALGYLDALRSRYGLGDRIRGVTRYTLWHLAFRDASLTPAQRKAYAEQVRDFFANPTFQKSKVVIH